MPLTLMASEVSGALRGREGDGAVDWNVAGEDFEGGQNSTREAPCRSCCIAAKPLFLAGDLKGPPGTRISWRKLCETPVIMEDLAIKQSPILDKSALAMANMGVMIENLDLSQGTKDTSHLPSDDGPI